LRSSALFEKPQSMTPTPLWYAVYTRPKWEKKVAALLSQKGLQNYCPLNRVLKQWHDRKKWVEEPLFTSYVFVCVSPSDLLEVRKTDGVLNFVYWLGKPAVIREEELTTIRKFLGEFSGVQLEKVRIRAGDKVQITQGPLMNQKGQVVEVHNKTVKVLLPTLGYALVAQVDKSNIELTGNAEEKKKAG
jgi:transcription antitermination factor NusG